MKERLLALDFLRGLSIFGMVFSAIIPYGVLPAWMYHIQNPPPTHQLDITVSGISWVDMVFPLFIFCMGVAIPLSGTQKAEAQQNTCSYIKRTFIRFLRLWLFSYLYVLTNFSNVEGFLPQYFTLLGFASIILLYIKNVKDPDGLVCCLGMRIRKKSLVRCAGALLAAIVILAGHLFFGEIVNFHRRGIIIFLLAFLYLFGSLIWYFTREKLRLRVIVFLMLLLFTHITRALDWPAITYANPDIRWWFNMEYFYFLLILIPATVVGDLYTGYAAKVADRKGVKLTPPAVQIIMAVIFLAAGILFIQLEGGITKVPCTISYTMVTLGISLLLFTLAQPLCRRFGKSLPFRIFIGAGANPLLSYIAFDNLFLPLLRGTGLVGLYAAAYPEGLHWAGLLRAFVVVLFIMWVVSAVSRRKIWLNA